MNVSTPIRPINIVQMIINFPAMESIGVKFRLDPTVLKAETTSNVSVNTGVPSSV